MNFEVHRLNSFENSLLPVEKRQLWAKNGFFCIANSVLQCFWCDVIVDGRLVIEQNDIVPVEQHNRMHIVCPFLTCREVCGNIPLENPLNFNDERCRLQTFRNWPHSYITPESLAKAGFYYIHKNDHVKCIACNGTIGQWEPGNEPQAEHIKFFPGCSIAQHLNPSTAATELPEGVQRVMAPKTQAHTTLENRMRSFGNWKFGTVQKPESLAEAGFYYLGNEDEVRCFYCNGGLRFWLVNDDPWFEHTRWFPQCQFVQLVKGPLYVETVQKEVREMTNSNTSPQPSLAQEPSLASAAAAALPANREPLMTLDEALSTEPVQMAMQMGLNAGRIRAVTKRRLDQTGRPYLTSQHLIEAVLDCQIVDESNNDDIDDNSSLNRAIHGEVSRILMSALEVSAENLSENRSTETDDEKTAKNNAESLAKASTSHTSPTSGSSSESEEKPVSVSLALEEENKRLKDARECKICMNAEVGVVFVPCGHLVSCVQCAPSLKKCCLCRNLIKGRVRTFLS